MEEKLYTIMLGNAVDGVRLFGIFDEVEEAVERAEQEFTSEEWNVVPIYNI